MESLMGVAAWSHNQGHRGRLSHFRSMSSVATPAASKPLQPASKSTSTSELPNISGSDASPQPTTTLPRRMPSSGSYNDDYDMSTIPDPRNKTTSPLSVEDMPSPPQHPDLSDEVASLSTKLINAINHQTTLDDTLSSTRMELEQAHSRIRELEEQNAQQREMLSGDVWVRRKSVEAEKTKIISKLSEEKKARQEVEQQKKRIEQELENLTAALFEEANKMVISAKEEARKEHDTIQHRNDQLRNQLADTENLLKLQQEQLVELKQAMEQMSSEQDEPSISTAPSSPGFSRVGTGDETVRTTDSGSTSENAETISPSYPTNFTHMLQLVIRTDLAAYDDFVSLIRTSRRASQQASRSPSGAHSGLASLGIGLGHASAPSNGSTSSLSTTAGTPTSAHSPQTPNTPASTVSSGSTAVPFNMPALKETKFFKRILAEDVEPTLRLDIAPGLSWLARRGVVNAMTEGTLIVDPVPTNTRYTGPWSPQKYPCALCGETRKDGSHLRTHRFRTSESDSAQRYPLCKYCLIRVRSTCDFLGFLRIVKDGHWRADDEDAEKAAWEESVRLREQMFWSRMGGGVIPITPNHHSHHVSSVIQSTNEKSARTSQEGETVPQPPSASLDTIVAVQDDAGSPVQTVEETDRQDHTPRPASTDSLPVGGSREKPSIPKDPASGDIKVAPTTKNRDSAPPLSGPPPPEKEGIKRLSLQIP